NDDLTTGGYNMARSFQVGHDNLKRYVNAPVAPQAIYLGYSTSGAGILDLARTGYNTNVPGCAAKQPKIATSLQDTRYQPGTQTGKASNISWSASGSADNTSHQSGFGIMGRYTSGGSQGLPSGVESELALGAAVPTGQGTLTKGVNEGSSGYETLVSSGVTKD